MVINNVSPAFAFNYRQNLQSWFINRISPSLRDFRLLTTKNHLLFHQAWWLKGPSPFNSGYRGGFWSFPVPKFGMQWIGLGKNLQENPFPENFPLNQSIEGCNLGNEDPVGSLIADVAKVIPAHCGFHPALDRVLRTGAVFPSFLEKSRRILCGNNGLYVYVICKICVYIYYMI